MGDSPKFQRVWLTGASGFVGGHVLGALLAGGHEVVVLARDPGRLKIDDPRVTVITGDLFDTEALGQCAGRADAAVHLVGIINERGGDQTFGKIHVEGTRAVVDACRQADIKRYVHMSALGARADSASRYHSTKAAAEQIVRDSTLAWTIFRPSVIHGPDGEFMQMVAGFATGFGPMPLLGPGRSKIQPIFADDLARIFADALARDETAGQSYDLVGPTALTWNELYRLAARILRGKEKAIVHMPVPIAKMMAFLFRITPLVSGPFNRDQVIMAQEDSIGDARAIEKAFGLELADFEPTLEAYRDELLANIGKGN